ncbi:MAG: hypothetical protein JWN52_7753 [Actinomycetia bacterium]|nr:hypothetical protein [Actinomycetes bacterium]
MATLMYERSTDRPAHWRVAGGPPDRGPGGNDTGRRGVQAWAAPLFGLGGAGLAVWTGYLAMSLPPQSVSPHYNIAWAGFDALLAGLVLTTAWLAYRRSPQVASTSAATAALLLADAWFDVTTAAPGWPLLAAALLAAFIELPAAVLALQVHRTASKRRSP